MTKPKIVIVVDGGNVQAIYGSVPIEVVLVDHDNLEAEGFDRTQRQEVEDDATSGLTEYAAEDPDKPEKPAAEELK